MLSFKEEKLSLARAFSLKHRHPSMKFLMIEHIMDVQRNVIYSKDDCLVLFCEVNF